MILSPAQLALVRDRRKTQIRLPREQDRRFGFLKPCPFTAGQMYLARAVNGGWTAAELREHRTWAEEELPSRARAVVAYLAQPIEDALAAPAPVRITVMDTCLAPLGSVDQQAARREGFDFLAHFENHWRSTHGRWEPEEPVWVISFEVGDQRHKFDRDLFMKATPGRGGTDVDEHQDYTDKAGMALDRDAPVVDAKSLERFAAEGAAGHARRKAAELRWQQARSLRIRLHDAERRKDPEALDAVLRDLQRLDGLAA